MLIASHDLRGYSQVGYVAGYANTVYVFAQDTTANSQDFYNRFIPDFGSIAPNSKFAIYEKYNSNCPAPTYHACEESLIGGLRVTDTNYDPMTYWPTTFVVEYMGEKTYQESDIMGVASKSFEL